MRKLTHSTAWMKTWFAGTKDYDVVKQLCDAYDDLEAAFKQPSPTPEEVERLQIERDSYSGMETAFSELAALRERVATLEAKCEEWRAKTIDANRYLGLLGQTFPEVSGDDTGTLIRGFGDAIDALKGRAEQAESERDAAREEAEEVAKQMHDAARSASRESTDLRHHARTAEARTRELAEALKLSARMVGSNSGYCWCVHRALGETMTEHEARCSHLRAVLGDAALASHPAPSTGAGMVDVTHLPDEDIPHVESCLPTVCKHGKGGDCPVRPTPPPGLLEAVERLVDVARRLASGAHNRIVWDDLDAALAAYDAAKESLS
ncbi:hypothetical protein [Myxococcus phage Mx1]|nr:hypothetical protein [Myxococcus phage Mx1]